MAAFVMTALLESRAVPLNEAVESCAKPTLATQRMTRRHTNARIPNGYRDSAAFPNGVKGTSVAKLAKLKPQIGRQLHNVIIGRICPGAADILIHISQLHIKLFVQPVTRRQISTVLIKQLAIDSTPVA